MKKFLIALLLVLVLTGSSLAFDMPWDLGTKYCKLVNGNITLTTNQFNYQQAAVYLDELTLGKLLLAYPEAVADNGTLTDLSGAVHNGTYADASDWTSGDKLYKILSSTLDFDGINDYITFADHADFTFINTDISVGGWIEIVAGTTIQEVISKWDETTGAELREWQLVIDAAEKLQIIVRDESVADASNAQASRLTDAALAAGWHFITVTYDNAGGTGATWANGVLIYVDGLVVASTATNDADFVDVEDLATIPVVGAFEGTAGTYTNVFKGDMGQLFFTKEALTAAQIWRLYIKTRGYLGL